MPPNTPLISMKRTPAQMKDDEAVSVHSKDEYPFGLEIRLDEESLKKMGIKVDKYTIGEKSSMFAKIKIEDLHGEPPSMNLQITHLKFIAGNPGNLSQTKSSASVEKDLDKMGLLD